MGTVQLNRAVELLGQCAQALSNGLGVVFDPSALQALFKAEIKSSVKSVLDCFVQELLTPLLG